MGNSSIIDRKPKLKTAFSDSTFQQARRSLVKGLSIGIGSSVLGAPIPSLGNTNQQEMEKRVSSPRQNGKLGIALVGLGQYSANELAPALLETEHCYLAGKPTYFYEVEESISWQIDFGNGVVDECRSSYFEEETAVLAAEAENGWWRLDPAYPYDGKKGETHEGKMDLPNINEQAKQMDGQALSFKNNEPSIVPGEMGLRDMKILEAIYNSANNGGKSVELQH